MPGVGFEASTVGTLSTLNENVTVQEEPGCPVGVSTIAGEGVKTALPKASGGAMAKVAPAQAVPAWPVPLALSAKTPGSISLQTVPALPQLGVRAMAVMLIEKAESGPVELLAKENDAERPVAAAVTVAGKLGVTSSATPACAGEKPTASRDETRANAPSGKRPEATCVRGRKNLDMNSPCWRTRLRGRCDGSVPHRKGERFCALFEG